MANNLNVPLPLEVINGGKGVAILTGKRPLYEYKEGRPVGNKPIGVTYSLALLGNRMSTISVKIKGVDALSTITDEHIQQKLASGRFCYVKFTNFTAKMYTIQGEVKFSCSADSIIVIEEDELADELEQSVDF